MNVPAVALDLVIVLLIPVLTGGLVSRRLWRDLTTPLTVPRPVTNLFPIAALARLASLLVAATLVPALPAAAPASFPFDFVVLAGTVALSRVALRLACLDAAGARAQTGIREFAGPILLLLGALLSLTSGEVTLDRMFGAAWLGRLLAAVVLLAFTATGSAALPAALARIQGPEAAALSYAGGLERGIFAALAVRLTLTALPPTALGPLPTAAATAALLLAVCWIFDIFNKNRLL